MSKTITASDLKSHTTPGDLWVLIEKKVYDVSEFMSSHPGGQDILLGEAGRDATGVFLDIGHSKDAEELMKGLYIGSIDEASAASLPSTHSPWTGKQRADGAVLSDGSFGTSAGISTLLITLVLLALLGLYMFM